MAPTLSRPPFHRDSCVYEEKVDGWRIVAYKDARRVRLVSRRGVDHTARFADLAACIARVRACTLVLDGELLCDKLKEPGLGVKTTMVEAGVEVGQEWFPSV